MLDSKSTPDDIRDYYDSNPWVLITDLCRLTGKNRGWIKAILLNQA